MRTRLTPFAKLLILIVVVAALFFGFRMFADSGGINIPANDEGAAEQQAESPKKDQKPASFEVRNFDFTPPAPQNGTLKGVVELGAAGFNSFIVEIDQNKNWRLEKAEWGNSLVYDGLASGKDITQGLKQYIADMLDYGVGGRNIHFVVSSGAAKVAATQKIISGVKSLGYVVNTVTPEKEAQLALRAALPDAYRDKAFVVDIGSGNTKISWADGSRVAGLETYGAKYYVDKTDASEVYLDARSKAARVPAALAKTCFILGGVPFQLAKQVRQGEERYTVLKAPGAYEADGAKEEAGINIYNAIADVTGCRQFVFDWDANFTIGFLLAL
ncbi:MAG: hypothetical protein H6557_17020 [Lewinellaceae bacterium]|nr:hypothetical protein [Phaeodactylibacter sp.]MCB9038319.1 hypothetical protein [Lewinellaceae bacterium]